MEEKRKITIFDDFGARIMEAEDGENEPAYRTRIDEQFYLV